MAQSVVWLEVRRVGDEAEQAGTMQVQVPKEFGVSGESSESFVGVTVSSVMDQDEFDSEKERRGPGGSREGSEEADKWSRREMRPGSGQGRWRPGSGTDCSPARTPVPTNLLLFCTFSHSQNWLAR